MGFIPVNFQFAMPFHFRLRKLSRTEQMDRRTTASMHYAPPCGNGGITKYVHTIAVEKHETKYHKQRMIVELL